MREPPQSPRRALGVAAVVLAGSLCPALAAAQSDADRGTARELGRDGSAALDQKDYRKAEDLFRRADKLVHAPTLLLGLARALAGEGKFVEATETYNRIVREGLPAGAPEAFKQALEAAKAEVTSVAPKVAGVTITVKADGGADVSSSVNVTVDDQAVNAASLGVRRLVDPGDHVVHAQAPGYAQAEARFHVGEGGSQTVELALRADASAGSTPPPAAVPGAGAPPEAHRGSVLPWIAFGVGAAGLVTGAVAGAVALGQHSSIAGDCGGSSCPASEQSKIDGFHGVAMVSNIGFVVAGVGAAAGVVLLLVRPGEGPAPAQGVRVTPAVGLGTLGAVGTF